MISLDSRPVPRSTVVSHTVEDEAVVLMPERGQVKVLNEVGTRIFALADGTRTIRDIAAVIHTEYDVELAQAEADVLDFLATLVTKDIVTLEPALPSS